MFYVPSFFTAIRLSSYFRQQSAPTYLPYFLLQPIIRRRFLRTPHECICRVYNIKLSLSVVPLRSILCPSLQLHGWCVLRKTGALLTNYFVFQLIAFCFRTFRFRELPLIGQLPLESRTYAFYFCSTVGYRYREVKLEVGHLRYLMENYGSRGMVYGAW